MTPVPPGQPQCGARTLGLLVGIAVVGIAGRLVWASFQPPPPCATDIDNHKAQVLFDAALRNADLRVFWMEGSLDRAEFGPFVVTSVYRKDEDNWPTYFVRGDGTLRGAHRVIIAIGNGCGLGDLQDLGDGPHITYIPFPSSQGPTT